MYLKVINQPTLLRDSSSQAIINTNDKELLVYKQKRERDRKLSKLESDVQEIKQMLKKLLEQNS